MTCPTTILPVGRFTVIELKVFAVRAKLEVVAAVPVSITYAADVWVVAWKFVLIGLVLPGLNTLVITYDNVAPALHALVHASVITNSLTLLLESAVLVHVFVVEDDVSVQTIASEDDL